MEYLPYVYATLVGLAVVGVVIWQIRTGRVRVDSFDSALRAFYDARTLVATYVPAADQLAKLGALKTNHDKLEYVMDMVLKYMKDFDPEALRGIIEGYINQGKAGNAGE